MFTKLKQLTSQEWIILILFAVSIATLILTVQLTVPGEESSVLSNDFNEENVLSYYVSNN